MSIVCAMRDFLIFAMATTSLHQMLNVASEGSAYAGTDESASRSRLHGCEVFTSPFSFACLALVILTSARSLYVYSNGGINHARWTWAVDAAGLVPGIYFQITTRPIAWWGAYSQCVLEGDATYVDAALEFHQQCSLETSPTAFCLFLLSEWLLYGTLLRLTVSAQFGQNVTNTTLIILCTLGVAGVQYWVANAMRDGVTQQCPVA